MLSHNSSVQIETAKIKKPCYVNSCHECCRETMPDGSPNIRGMLHQKEYTIKLGRGVGAIEHVDCKNCPITLSQSEEEWNEMLAEIDGQE